jgi:hypothetical protein
MQAALAHVCNRATAGIVPIRFDYTIQVYTANCSQRKCVLDRYSAYSGMQGGKTLGQPFNSYPFESCKLFRAVPCRQCVMAVSTFRLCSQRTLLCAHCRLGGIDWLQYSHAQLSACADVCAH